MDLAVEGCNPAPSADIICAARIRRRSGALHNRPVPPAARPRPHTQEVLPMPETVTAAAQDLRGLAVAALTAAGAQPRHAEWTADILVEGDLMGLGTHGVLRLLLYCERLRLAGIKGAADIRSEEHTSELQSLMR